MRIALDAMGSDGAPGPEVNGAVDASATGDIEVILVGDEAKVTSALRACSGRGNVSIVHASQVIAMDEKPMMAVRKKKDSSLMGALRLVKEGRADAVVSAGNTGAVMVASRTVLGPIRGVARSAICQVVPTSKNLALLLDVGANVDCSARHLCEFAEMGVIYTKFVLNVDNPRVGLLNIGEEQSKGNEVAKTVHANLSAAEHINFLGNVEPKVIFNGDVDVVVSDGFVGNIILKTSEAVAGFLKDLARRALNESLVSKMGGLLSSGALKRLKKTTDPNEYSGAPLLGVNGTVICQHGASNARGIANAIRGACRVVELDINQHIRHGIEVLRAREDRVKAKESVE